MEKEKIIVANHKMNLTAEKISEYLKKLNESKISKQVIICPTSIYLPYFLKKTYDVGLQNTFLRSKGAYTGEISPKQAAHMGVNYTIIGHSERRTYFKENDELISKKTLEAIKYNLKVILCIGETLEERNMLKTDQILKRQLYNALRPIDEKMLNNVIIAYEPIWAIGSKKTPTKREIEKTVYYIKKTVEQYKGFKDIKVLYGGSVSSKNIKQLNKIENIAGFLVGNASLEVEEFLEIVNEVVV